MERKKVLVVLADGFEEIEAIAPIDILRRADICVTVAGLSAREVKSARGIKILADTTLESVKGEYDAIVFPGGGAGAENLSKSRKVKSLIKKMYKKGKVIAAICASPAVVLAPTGILTGKMATCYPGMEKEFSPETAFSDEEVVVDGNIVTGKGPAAALLFGLKLVEILVGREIASSLKEKILL